MMAFLLPLRKPGKSALLPILMQVFAHLASRDLLMKLGFHHIHDKYLVPSGLERSSFLLEAHRVRAASADRVPPS